MQSEEDGRDDAGFTVAKKTRARPPTTTLGALIQWLDSENVRGIIIGGIAASLLGHPCFTRDIEALILLEEEEKLLLGAHPRKPRQSSIQLTPAQTRQRHVQSRVARRLITAFYFKISFLQSSQPIRR